MMNNKRKAEFSPNYSSIGKKGYRFGGNLGYIRFAADNTFNDMSAQQNHCKGRGFTPRFWSPPPHQTKQSPMGSVFNHPPFGFPPEQMSSPQKKIFKPNPDSRPVYESRDWNPTQGWHYKPTQPSDSISSDLSEIVFELRRTTDTLKSEMRAIRDGVELSNRQMKESFKESITDLKNSLVEAIKECKSEASNSQPLETTPKIELN